MNINEWRKKNGEGEKFTTPSGLDVVLKRVSMLDLAAAGEIPVPLMTMANKIANDFLDLQKLPEGIQVVDLVVTACLMEPKAGEDFQVSELPVRDRIAIWSWAIGGAARLAPFRAE
jgi:hypothetical protein